MFHFLKPILNQTSKSFQYWVTVNALVVNCIACLRKNTEQNDHNSKHCKAYYGKD